MSLCWISLGQYKRLKSEGSEREENTILVVVRGAESRSGERIEEPISYGRAKCLIKEKGRHFKDTDEERLISE